MENSSFFNAVIQNGVPDRIYKADIFADYFSSFIGNGVFPNPGTNLQVLATDNNMTVRIKAGKAFINGYYYSNDDDLILSVANADGVLNRIDRIVIRLDLESREIKAHIKKGTFATNPIPPEINRTDYYYELAIADIRVSAGCIKIVQSNITDTRLNTSVCGIVTQTIKEIDTSELYKTLQAYIDERGQDVDGWVTEATTKWERDFINWFNSIKDVLDGDVAGALANRILELENTVNNMELTSTKVTRPGGKTVEESISANETSIQAAQRDIVTANTNIINLQNELIGQRQRLLNSQIEIRKLL